MSQVAGAKDRVAVTEAHPVPAASHVYRVPVSPQTKGRKDINEEEKG
jgi:hypothetical protein